MLDHTVAANAVAPGRICGDCRSEDGLDDLTFLPAAMRC
jgi:hypothetical protein